MVKQMTQGGRPAQDDIDIARLAGALLDHKWWIALITLVFAVGAVIHVQLATPVYRADALVQVEGNAGLSNPLSEVRSMLDQQPKAEAQLEILRSRMVLGQAIDRERLDIVVTPSRFPLIGEFLVRRGVKRPGFADRSVWAGEFLSVGKLRVDEAWLGRPLRVVAAGAGEYRLYDQDRPLGEGRVGEDEQFANGQIDLRIAELEAGEGAEFTLVRRARLSAINGLGARFSVAQRGRDSGVFRLALRDTQPERAEDTLSAIAEIYLTQNIRRQSAEAEKSLEFLREQLPQVREELVQAENALNRYRTQRDSVDLSMETRSVLDRLVQLESQIKEMELEEAELSHRFNAAHPTYAAMLDKKQNLQRERERLNDKISGMPETQQQVLRLSRDVEVTQEVYVQLRNKIQEMSITKASTVGNVRILDDAVVQPVPVAPRKAATVVFMTLVGGFLAVGFVLLRSVFSRAVESAEQIEELGLPVYATVPLSDEQQKMVRRFKHRHHKRGRAVTSGVLARREADDTAIESLRGLRTSLHFAMLESRDNRLMITGPSPGVGKSFVTINLGAVCAQGGQRVLVIDADMRKGHLHTAFGVTSEGGLSEVLSGKCPLDEAVRPSTVDGLSFITRGKAPPNPAELLMGDRFTSLLYDLAGRFDLIIIDTPPVLAVTDAAVVGKQCGTTLMVARYGLNPPKEIRVALGRLESSGVTVKGAILNAVEPKAATSFGYGYYHYAYKSGG